jgi:hypothetical protein
MISAGMSLPLSRAVAVPPRQDKRGKSSSKHHYSSKAQHDVGHTVQYTLSSEHRQSAHGSASHNTGKESSKNRRYRGHQVTLGRRKSSIRR